jgi:hypothetical protein
LGAGAAGAAAGDDGLSEKDGGRHMAGDVYSSERPLSDDLSTVQAHNIPPTVTSGDTASELQSPISPVSPEFVPAHPAEYHVTK